MSIAFGGLRLSDSLTATLRWQSAIGAQGLWSATSFIIAIYSARHLTVDQFGLFAVVIAARQFFLALLGALVLSPVTIIASRFSDATLRANLMGSLLFLLQAVSLAFLVFGTVIGFLFGWPGLQFAVFVAGGLSTELQRRINFIENRIHQDIIGGLVSFVGSTTCLLVLSRWEAYTLGNVLLLLGLTSLSWAAFSGRKYWLGFPIKMESADLGEMWRIGRWELGSNLAQYGYSQVSTLYTLGLIGTAGVGVLELGRQLVAFVQVFLQSAANLYQPKLARSAQTHEPKLFLKDLWRLAQLQTIVGTILLLCVLTASPYLIPLIVPGKEQAYALSIPVAWILSGAMVCQLLWQHLSFGVTALGRPDYGFLTRLVAAALLIPAGYILTLFHGVRGAAWSRALGEGLILILTIVMLYRVVKARGSPQSSMHGDKIGGETSSRD